MGSVNIDSLTRYWVSLPEELRQKLRLGFVGKRHLLDVAGWCIRSGDDTFTPIAADALRTVIRENPLDGAMAHELLSLEPVRGLLDRVDMEHLSCLAEHWRRPDNLDAYRQVQAGRDFLAIKEFIRVSAAAQSHNLFWLEQAVVVGCVESDHGFIAECFSGGHAPGVEGVVGSALRRVELLFPPERREKESSLSDRLSRTPWNTSLALRFYDQCKGVSTKRESLPGSVAILLYSWNKADELDATLASLSEADLDGASLFVLDNGSTDRTGEILRKWESRFSSLLGSGRFSTVSLPVNVGAAAARNWLLHMEAVQAHEFVCYLDDDVELPSDWLSLLGAAVAEYPDAGVWGCKVVDYINPLLIQSADSHLLVEPNGIMDLTKTAPNPFKLSDLHIQTLDTGSFDFLRPCASVTGCCHLFRTETLLESGDFAIQLSPSQYDDMEHDLRLCEAGRFPIYQGHLAVRHKKRTGAASRTSMQEEGNAIGNKYKMQTMHSPAEVAAASEAEQRVLDEDILRKLAYLDQL